MGVEGSPAPPTAEAIRAAEGLRGPSGWIPGTGTDDPVLGYAVQTMISRVYFKRYIDTMRKLQTVAEALALST